MEQQIGRYEIRRELGRGGMAIVYLAYDPRFRRQIAIKVLPRQFTHDPRYLARFEQEAQLIAALEHQAIVPVYDFGEHEDAPYLVMRYMSGGSLSDRLSGEPLSLEEITSALERLAPALDKAHEMGVIHRDLKPGNVLFDDDGNPYLGDFGIARLAEASQTLTVVGTPAYMSPEQVRGDQEPDGRADIYALGVMLYELFTGHQPYQADTPTKQMMAHVLEPVPDVLKANPDLPLEAQEIIDKAMAKDRDERYATAAELVTAVNDLAALESAEAAEIVAPPISPDDLPLALDEAAEEIEPASSVKEIDESMLDQPGEPEVEAPVEVETAAEVPLEVPVVESVSQEDEAVEAGGMPGWLKWLGALALLITAIFAVNYVISRIGGDDQAPGPPDRDDGKAGYLDRAIAGDFAGTTVTIFAGEHEAPLFDAVFTQFEDDTGIDVQLISARGVDELYAAIDAGEPPDIVDFSQPGVVAEFAAEGKIVDVTSFLPEEILAGRYNQSWLDMATVAGPDGEPIIGGVWQRFIGKSFVWYPKKAFEERGYPVPETWLDLQNLTQRIIDDAGAPWCIGIESGAATGWVATDWTEDLLLRTAPLEEYDAWVSGDLPFDSPRVRTAVHMWSEMWFAPASAYGGRDFIVNTSFIDSVAPMFDNPPSCWLHRQANAITGAFPDDAEYGRDYGVFYLPPVVEDFGRPFLMAGNIMSMFNDREEVRAVMEYFTTPESTLAWTQDGSAFSPHLQASPDMYGNEMARDLSTIFEQATSLRFDGSDLMPGEVGAGAFWAEMTDYVAGETDLDTALQKIDAAWPR